MSQGPSASRPASRSPKDGQRISLPPVQLRDDFQRARQQQQQQHPLDGVEYSQDQSRHSYASSQHSPTPTETSQSQRTPPTSFPQTGELGNDRRFSGPSRALGVHTILNPTDYEGSETSSAHFGSRVSQSPQSTTTSLHYGQSPKVSSAQSYSGPQSGSTPSADPQGAGLLAPRRILTPKSPRAVSLGRSVGTIDAQRAPFLSSRPTGNRLYAADQGPPPSTSDVPPLPTPPTHSQHSYAFPQQSLQTPVGDRRASLSSMPGLMKTPLSQSASPSTSLSSFGQSNQTSPASLYQSSQQAPAAPATYFAPSTFGGPTHMGGATQTAAPASEGPYTVPQTGSLHPMLGSLSSQGQMSNSSSSAGGSASTGYQLWTLKNDSGTFQIPVDVQAASKVADEKRARNAGASARFRQRRKEKEREASTSMQKLEQQARDLERKVREVEQERDFYRGERDRFRDVLYLDPGTREIAMQSPPSPRHAGFNAASMSAATPHALESGHPPTAERAPRRRRTEGRAELTGGYNLPPSTSLPPAPQPGYGPGQPPSNLPPLRMEMAAPGGTSGPPSVGSAGPSPYDPYPPRANDGGWPRDNGRGRGQR